MIEQAGGRKVDAATGEYWRRALRHVEWRALVAELVIELQWTREQVLDQVDIPFLEELHRAWADVRRCAGWSRPISATSREPRPSKNYHELIAMFPSGTIK